MNKSNESPYADSVVAEWCVEYWDGKSENEDSRTFATASEASEFAHKVFNGHPAAYVYVDGISRYGYRVSGTAYGYRH